MANTSEIVTERGYKLDEVLAKLPDDCFQFACIREKGVWILSYHVPVEINEVS